MVSLPMIDYAAARLNMVEGQLRTNGITDPGVVEAFLGVPRQRFVPEPLRGIAYVDEDVPLGNGRYLMEPLVLARLIQLAQTRPDEQALFLGAGTGYGVAILARLVGSVIAVEPDERLAAEARRHLAVLGASNATVAEGPLPQGHEPGAPYDVILFGGGIAEVPDAIAEQLAERGRLVAVIKPDERVGQATVMTRTGRILSRRPSFDAATPLLPGLEAQPSFVF